MAEGKRLAVEFLTSAPDLTHCPPENQPEVALTGRSNAGKSSVLNRLTGNSRYPARTSKTPGRTRMLNFFALPGGARLVDLPGLRLRQGCGRAPKRNGSRRYTST